MYEKINYNLCLYQILNDYYNCLEIFVYLLFLPVNILIKKGLIYIFFNVLLLLPPTLKSSLCTIFPIVNYLLVTTYQYINFLYLFFFSLIFNLTYYFTLSRNSTSCSLCLPLESFNIIIDTIVQGGSNLCLNFCHEFGTLKKNKK